MLVRNGILTVLTTASYLLAISASALFHEHHGHDDEQTRPGVSASPAADEEHDCSVCQFLAQKPAPVADVAPVGSGSLVEDVAALAPASADRDVVAAWHSRAPPVFA
jgi:hypothetical protein